MTGLGEHIAAMVRTHGEGDSDAFYAVAMQIAAREARQGHHLIAAKLKRAIETGRLQNNDNVRQFVRPHSDSDELIEASFPDSKLRQFVGPNTLVSSIGKLINEQRNRVRLVEHGFPPASKLLVEGPPGTGKTMAASVIASELGLPLFAVRFDTLISKYLGESSTKLRSVFDSVNERRGVYFFDEFDALGADRSGNDVGEARRILNTFLVNLEAASANSIVIAATNHRSILDRALFRRFDQVLSFSLPDARQSKDLITLRLGSMVRSVDWSRLEQVFSGLSHSELIKAAESAARDAILEHQVEVSTVQLENSLMERQTASGVRP